ncbi:hypothetical protein LCGC14_0043120 [marine sediment metagenome]|uniref:Uncharacterized protein n=1 Tax=marine sediment metagenome TaxID=412755 RepID=A0A0F9YUA5_9ZZZZ
MTLRYEGGRALNRSSNESILKMDQKSSLGLDTPPDR